MITYLNKVAVRELQQGGVGLTRFSHNDMQKYGYIDEDQFISFYMNRIFPGETFSVISDSDIPKDQNGEWDKTQRDCWMLKNKKIGIDQNKVKAKEDKENEKLAVFQKLGITKDEFQKIRGK